MYTSEELFKMLLSQIDTSRTTAEQAQAASAAEKAALQQQLDDLTKPPAITHLCQCIIVKDETPGTVQDTMVRQIIDIAVLVGCGSWRGFLNASEAAKMVGTAFNTDGNLPGYGQKKGLSFMADTVDSDTLMNLTDSALTTYYLNLKLLGTVGAVVNDADAAKHTALDTIVTRTRKAMQAAGCTFPLIASCSASVDIAHFRTLFDVVECQCFWQNTDELKGFMKLPIDCWCLDTQRSMSLTELQQQTAIVIPANLTNLSFYAGHDYDNADWRKMGWSNNAITPGSQLAEIQKMVHDWKAGLHIS